MPQGKGTYGSQVGRPPKKKKYQAGGSIDPFSEKNPEGMTVQREMEAIEEQNAMPTANAQERSQVFREGGKLEDWKEEGYDYYTKLIKDEILGKKRNIYDRDVTDIVELRSRRQKEVEKANKKRKKKK